jgi:hypothetical protein
VTWPRSVPASAKIPCGPTENGIKNTLPAPAKTNTWYANFLAAL